MSDFFLMCLGFEALDRAGLMTCSLHQEPQSSSLLAEVPEGCGDVLPLAGDLESVEPIASE